MKAIKEFGQHFLNDPSIAEDIATAAQLSESDRVWEVGPGLGILTHAICNSAASLRAYELDRRLKSTLEEEFGDRIELVMQDILSVNWQQELITQAPIKIVANIPYQITSPLLYQIEANAASITRVVMMIQKEVADRLTAIPGTKDYGQITLRLRLLFDISVLFYVGREKFSPAPRVDSAVILMTPRKDVPQIDHPAMFHRLINVAFAHRRKTLRNNLKSLIPADKLDKLQELSKIELSRRGETLSEEEFILLSDTAVML